MLDSITSFIAGNTALLVAMLALVASMRANYISNKANKITEQQQNNNLRLKNLEKRTEILSEIDTQNARYGALLAIFTEKIFLFQKNEKLLETYPKEYERISKNMMTIEKLKSRYDKQRGLSEQVGANADLEKQEIALAEIRRLTIHLDEDIKKETGHLNEVKKLIRDKA